MKYTNERLNDYTYKFVPVKPRALKTLAGAVLGTGIGLGLSLSMNSVPEIGQVLSFGPNVQSYAIGGLILGTFISRLVNFDTFLLYALNLDNKSDSGLKLQTDKFFPNFGLN